MMRYERKYRITDLQLAHIIQAVKYHPTSFRKIYPDRKINNIYFDTLGLQTYRDNVMGIAERQKFRIRWYGDTRSVMQPKLEIKKRLNELGTKEIFNLESFDLNALERMSDEITRLTKTNTHLQPILLNAYQRSYWGSPDGKFRITIDHDMCFHSKMNMRFRSFQIWDEAIILELKYDQVDEKHVDRIAQFIPFRRTKNSKYVNGVALTHPELV